MAFIYLEPKVTEQINRFNFKIKLVLSTIIPIVLFIIAILTFPDSEIEYGLIGGGLLGLSVGYLLEVEYVQYDPAELNNKQKIINLIIGLVLILGLYLALDLLVSIENHVWAFFKYLITILTAILLVPWILQKIRR